MRYEEIFKEFTSLFPLKVVDYRPVGEDTIVVWADDGTSLIAKRISETKFEVTSLMQTKGIYATNFRVGKNGENVIYNHNRKALSESEFIWKIENSGISFSYDGGITWTKV